MALVSEARQAHGLTGGVTGGRASALDVVLPHPDPSDVRREEYAHLEAPLKAIAEVHPEQTGTSLNLMREKQSRDVSEVNRPSDPSSTFR